jgi:excisionase family DNA binding protein
VEWAVDFLDPETAKIFGVSRWTAYEWAKAGKIPIVKIGGRVFVPRHALEKLLDVTPAPQPAARPVT